MNRTNIEWVKNPDGSQGYTWNPITGCLNDCPYCYARKLANGRLKQRYLANKYLTPYFEGFPLDYNPFNDPFYPRLWEDRLNELNPLYGQDHRSQFRGIFVCDMSDLFGVGIPREWTRRVLDRISEFYYHRFYLLTKQPQNLIKFSPFPDNCWVGVTATNAKMAEEAGFWLWEVKAKVKFVSFEPLLERISPHFADYISEDVESIKWVIIGAQTKPYKPPKIEWVQEILIACHNANIPIFMKDNLRPLIDNSVGWGEAWKLRQEMPK